MTNSCTAPGQGTDVRMKQILKAKWRSQDFPPRKYTTQRVTDTTSAVSAQLISRQSGFGWIRSQVGSKASVAVQKAHFATGEFPDSAGGRVFQRIMRRYRQITGMIQP